MLALECVCLDAVSFEGGGFNQWGSIAHPPSAWKIGLGGGCHPLISPFWSLSVDFSLINWHALPGSPSTS